MKHSFILLAVVLVSLTRLHAQAPAAPAAAAAAAPPPPPDGLKGLGFGVGLGFRANVTGPDIVSDATVDTNGIVRVTGRTNTAAGLVLEMHHYVKTFFGDTFGIGPF